MKSPNRKRDSLLAISILALVACAPVAPVFADALDTAKLPRLGGGQTVYAGPSSTIFTTSGTVPEAADAATALLKSNGWQPYGRENGDDMRTPDYAILNFKKGMQGLSVFVSVAPAQNNATTVNYTTVLFANELPFPAEATSVRYDADRPFLSCKTKAGIDATLTFFHTELAARGWTPWSMTDRAKAPIADQKTATGAQAFYVHDTKKPLRLSLTTESDGTLAVKIEAVPAAILTAEVPNTESTSAGIASGKGGQTSATGAAANEEEPAPSFDDLTAGIMKDVQSAVQQALKDGGAPPVRKTAKNKQVDAMPAEMLAPLAGNSAPIPVPFNAEHLDFDGAGGELNFTTPSDVRLVADFYRTSMKPLGWKSLPSVIDKDNMVVLSYTKGEGDLTITIMRMGKAVDVKASGSALEVENPSEATTTGVGSATTVAIGGDTPATDDDAAEQNLEAEDVGGLPVPKDHTSSGREKTLFRYSANASVPANVKSVVAFYRRELTARGWTEDAARAVTKPDHAELAFTSPEGPALLTADRVSGETRIVLAVRQETAAKKSGLIPAPGKTKVLFGSMSDKDATITIGSKLVKIAAGAGAEKPDGPSLELAPGKYTYKFKSGNAAESEEIVIGEGEIWGLMIGPGGVLPLQVY